MHPSEVNRLRREIRRLVAAEADMRLVAAGAEALANERYVSNTRLLEVGLVVVYCRGFSGPPREDREPRTVVDTLAPDSPLHVSLFELRNKLYAHTDDDYKRRREAVDVFGTHSYSEQYSDLSHDGLERIRELAQAMADRLNEAREDRRRRCGTQACHQSLSLEARPPTSRSVLTTAAGGTLPNESPDSPLNMSVWHPPPRGCPTLRRSVLRAWQARPHCER